MPLGLPIPEKLKKQFRDSEGFVRLFSIFYRPYLRFYVKVWTWWKFNRFNEAGLQPFRLLWINPDSIEYKIRPDSANFNDDFFRPRVLGGDWDSDVKRFREQDFFISLDRHFSEDVDWEDTLLFANRMSSEKEYMEEEEAYAKTMERLNKVDELYGSIESDGYRLQSDLKRAFNTKDIASLNKYLWSFNEVIVSIGRDGEILLEDGNHRLAISKILGIDEIPVRVLVRHEKWQKIRERISGAESIDELEPEILKFRDHPDVEDIFP